jgi:A/G-specific adenine glycosylase
MERNVIEDRGLLPLWINDTWLKSFRQKLVAWYGRDGRKLPWRDTVDPYEVLVSEIMLQQTQIATVIPYYKRFLDRFPNPHSLAIAKESDVLAMWEGLGYYRRARSLQRAAATIVNEFGGKFPENLDAIQSLPGVGRYTAGAVASFALSQRQPIVEANTQRLYARLMNLEVDVKSSNGQRTLWDFAERILPKKDSATVNHAVMDLGAMICKPKAPNCLICPVRPLCECYARQSQSTIPVTSVKKKFVDQFEIAVALRDKRGKVFIWQRPNSGWWAGMWDIPRMFCSKQDWADKSVFEHWFSSQFGFECRLLGSIGNFRHTVTHHRIQCHLYTGEWKDFEQGSKITHLPGKLHDIEKRRRNDRISTDFGGSTAKWATERQLSKLPFSSSGRRMLDTILKNS